MAVATSTAGMMNLLMDSSLEPSWPVFGRMLLSGESYIVSGGLGKGPPLKGNAKPVTCGRPRRQATPSLPLSESETQVPTRATPGPGQCPQVEQTFRRSIIVVVI